MASLKKVLTSIAMSPQTLRYLAEAPRNINTMKNELGMMVSLETLMERWFYYFILFTGRLSDPETTIKSNLTIITFRCITVHIPSILLILKILFCFISFSPFCTVWRTNMTTDITDLAKEVYVVLSAQTQRQACQTPEQQKRNNKPQFFINSSNKKAKSVTLHIQGLDGAVCTISSCHTCSLLIVPGS